MSEDKGKLNADSFMVFLFLLIVYCLSHIVSYNILVHEVKSARNYMELKGTTKITVGDFTVGRSNDYSSYADIYMFKGNRLISSTEGVLEDTSYTNSLFPFYDCMFIYINMKPINNMKEEALLREKQRIYNRILN